MQVTCCHVNAVGFESKVSGIKTLSMSLRHTMVQLKVGKIQLFNFLLANDR